jgi:hypothetical protein
MNDYDNRTSTQPNGKILDSVLASGGSIFLDTVAGSPVNSRNLDLLF